jgi:hypothetical protein
MPKKQKCAKKNRFLGHEAVEHGPYRWTHTYTSRPGITATTCCSSDTVAAHSSRGTVPDVEDSSDDYPIQNLTPFCEACNGTTLDGVAPF